MFKLLVKTFETWAAVGYRLEFLACMPVKKALPLEGEMAAFGCGTLSSNQSLKLISGRLSKDTKVMSCSFNGFPHIWIMDCDSI